MKTTETTTTDIKFNMHNITSKALGKKVRVFYHLDDNVNHDQCVTIYAKDYSAGLSIMFDGVKNDTDSQTDYFEKDRLNLIPGHPYYEAARKIAVKAEAAWKKRYDKHEAKLAARYAA